jgi:DNA modification methylase
MRIDLNEDMPADYHMDAYDFVKMAIENEWLYDTIIFDPPYNLRKSREKYNGIYTSRLRLIRNELSKILKMNGYVLSFGYDSVGMGKNRGFELIKICLVCHGGDHNDTICIIEKKTNNLLL